jgi:hypothetical protein
MLAKIAAPIRCKAGFASPSKAVAKGKQNAYRVVRLWGLSIAA